ncbi:MAG: response regulator [Longimicrobiales bacterium]
MPQADPTPGTTTVLIVEDDPDHAVLLGAAFRNRAPGTQLRVASTAEEAMAYLLGTGPHADRGASPLPALITLDIGLPGMDGIGFLHWLSRREEAWKDTPVVVVTGSVDRTTRHLALALGAREVCVKPPDFGVVVDLIQAILVRRKDASA